MAASATTPDLWGKHAEDWAFRAEPSTAPLWKTILEATGVGSATRLLDIGCGAGGLCVLARQMGASVHGADGSPGLLNIARQRLPEGTFSLGNLLSLPYEDDFFDVVVSCNAIQFTADPEMAVKEALRVLRPERKFALGIWAEPEKCQMSVLFKALAALAPAPPEDHAPPSLSSRENLLSLLERAGLQIEQVEEIEIVFEYDNVDDNWMAVHSAGMIVGLSTAVGEEKVEAVVRTALKDFVQPDGKVKMSNVFRYVIGSQLTQQPPFASAHPLQ